MQIFRYGKYEDQFDIIPYISIYCHTHNYEFCNKMWHFHISIQWIVWYFEIQIGRDYNE